MTDSGFIPKGMEEFYDLDFKKLLEYLTSLPEGKYDAKFFVIPPAFVSSDPLELAGCIGYEIDGHKRIICRYYSGGKL